MITSHIMMSTLISHPLFQFFENTSSLIEVASYDYDLGLDVGELIKISNIKGLCLEDYTFEARVKTKSKILKEKVMVNDVRFTVGIEYVVEFENKQDDYPFLSTNEESRVSSDSDVFLMTVVDLVEKSLLRTWITLFVQGTVISGMLISADDFFTFLEYKLHNPDLPRLSHKTETRVLN